MATTITPATLTVTIDESVILNGKTYERIVTVPTSAITIVNYGAANAAGTFTRSGVLSTEGSRIKTTPTL
jgi:hypothetical protein